MVYNSELIVRDSEKHMDLTNKSFGFKFSEICLTRFKFRDVNLRINVMVRLKK